MPTKSPNPKAHQTTSESEAHFTDVTVVALRGQVVIDKQAWGEAPQAPSLESLDRRFEASDQDPSTPA
jgi:hypothetical protein